MPLSTQEGRTPPWCWQPTAEGGSGILRRIVGSIHGVLGAETTADRPNNPIRATCWRRRLYFTGRPAAWAQTRQQRSARDQGQGPQRDLNIAAGRKSRLGEDFLSGSPIGWEKWSRSARSCVTISPTEGTDSGAPTLLAGEPCASAGRPFASEGAQSVLPSPRPAPESGVCRG